MRVIACLLALLALLALPAAAQQSSRTIYTSAAQEAGHAICTGSCNLNGFQVNNWDTTTAITVMMFGGTVIPADGTVAPVKWWPLAAAPSAAVPQVLAVSWLGGLQQNGGVTLVCSTTGPYTKTAHATCTFSGDVQ